MIETKTPKTELTIDAANCALITAEEIEDTYAIYDPCYDCFDIWVELTNGEDIYLTCTENAEEMLRYIYRALDSGKTLADIHNENYGNR